MNLLNPTIIKLLNAVKNDKQYILLTHTKTTYLIVLFFKKYFIDTVYILKNLLLIYFKQKKYLKNISIKLLNLKNKQNFYSLARLKELYKKKKDGIIFTSKGIYSLNKAIKIKQGGVLFCLIYYSN